jgi:hypothetical protein
LPITKAVFASKRWVIFALPLVRWPSYSGSCPSECPSWRNTHRFSVRIISLTWVELSGLEPLTSCMPSGGSTSTRVYPCRSLSSRVPASPPASVSVAVLPCCTAAICAGAPAVVPRCDLTSVNPLRQVTGASFGVYPVKQAPPAGPSPPRAPSPSLPTQAVAWLADKHPARRTRRCTSTSPSAESSASRAAHSDADNRIGLHGHLDRPPNLGSGTLRSKTQAGSYQRYLPNIAALAGRPVCPAQPQIIQIRRLVISLGYQYGSPIWPIRPIIRIGPRPS